MKTYLGLASIAVFAAEAEAMSRHKEAYLSQVEGIDMDVLKGSVGWVATKSNKLMVKKERQASKKLAAHRL
jgi:hypothetical protein